MSKIQFIDEHFEEIKKIQEKLLDFIESDDSDSLFSNLIQLFNKLCIKEDKYKMKEVIHIIAKISAHHHRNINFFQKIEQILLFFSKQIEEFYSNLEIFNLFKSDKRLLLFLFEKNILKPTEEIYSIINDDKYKKKFYLQYFYLEFKNIFSEQKSLKIKKEIPSDNDFELFKKMRKTGENETYICSLIRNDSVIDFIAFINKKNISLTTTIEPTIFETNNYLLKNKPSLIEYAAFFGSIRIFNYLYQNEINVSFNLCLYSVHSQNPELFQLITEKVPEKDIQYEILFYESLKCHHNDFAIYFHDNFLQLTKYVYYIKCLKNHNLLFTLDKFNYINDWLFFFCQYDYFIIVDFLLQNKLVDINYYYILYHYILITIQLLIILFIVV